MVDPKPAQAAGDAAGGCASAVDRRLARLVAGWRGIVDNRAATSPGPELERLRSIVEQLAVSRGRTRPMAATDGGASELWTTVFGLTDLDVDVLINAAAPDLDPGFGLACAALQGSFDSQRTTVATAFELAGCDPRSPAHRARLSPRSPLRRFGLLVVDGGGTFFTRTLRVPDRVVAHLLGDPTVSPDVARLVTAPVPVDGPGAAAIASALQGGAPLVYVRSPPGTAGLSVAAAAIRRLNVPWLAVDLHYRARSAPLPALLADAIREAALLGRALLLAGIDDLVESDPALLADVADAPVPVVAVGVRRWDASWLHWLPVLVDAEPITTEQRRTLWLQAAAHQLPDGIDLHTDIADLCALSLTPDEIGQATGNAAATAADRQPTVADLRAAARRVGSASVGGAHVREAAATFADIVLPATAAAALREFVSWARHRDAVLGNQRLAGKGRHGRGLVALFTGSPGTGKTLAAQVVATELGLDLLAVDLSAVVDKYIGETEKNIERIFDRAENLNCVLLFDEADALFGARSEVRDARDRYANQEIAYLLQRLENFDGIAILATNLRGNIDAAFTRRMHFVIQFLDPTADNRRQLWQSHLPATDDLDPTDPIDCDLLGDALELTGCDIRNIVMAAAFDAAIHNQTLGHRHIITAIGREFRKLARIIPTAAASQIGLST
jgi:hypothetical protein